jgi:hypothetical protein
LQGSSSLDPLVQPIDRVRGLLVLAVAYLLAGAVGVVAGVWVLFGIGWALLAAGVLLLGLGALEARGGQPAVEAERVASVGRMAA